MTFKALKRKIYALLDLPCDEVPCAGSLAFAAEQELVAAINGVVRKTARYKLSFVKTTKLQFAPSEAGYVSTLPTDFISVKRLAIGDRACGRERFEVVGTNLYLFGTPTGDVTLFYFAYPPALEETVCDGEELAFDDFFADTVAYGVAAALCMDLYPSDMTRYMRLATEYDERIVWRDGGGGERTVSECFFSGQRGCFL